MIQRIKSFFEDIKEYHQMTDWFNSLLHKMHFGYSFVKRKEHEEALLSLAKTLPIIAENTSLKDEIDSLRKEIVTAHELNDDRYNLAIPVDLKDPEPQDREKRKIYVAEVAELYESILKPKFFFMISNLHILLEDETNNSKSDQSIKGAIYALREILFWAKKMYNEQMANVKGEDPSVPDNKIKEINKN